MTINYQISTERNNYPNLTVYDTMSDNAVVGWKITANEGYVFYDTNEETFELNDKGEELPVTYYYAECYLPNHLNWNTFSLVAVERETVEEKYIL